MVTFSHNFWNGFDRDAFLHGSSMNNEIWWMSQWFPQKWRINGSTREETDIRTTSKGGWLQKSRNQNPLEQHTHTKKKWSKKLQNQVSSSTASDTSWDSSASWAPADPLWSGASSVSTSGGASQLGNPGWRRARQLTSKSTYMPPETGEYTRITRDFLGSLPRMFFGHVWDIFRI